MCAGYAVFSSVFGYLQLQYTTDAITRIRWLPDHVSDWGVPTALTQCAQRQLEEYFCGKRRAFSFPYAYSGSEFQKKVWSALLTIPYGETRTYREIACQIDNPKAARAVGNASRSNPLMIVIPCHRVLGAGGAPVGYAGGPDKKMILLQLERNFHDPEYTRLCGRKDAKEMLLP